MAAFAVDAPTAGDAKVAVETLVARGPRMSYDLTGIPHEYRLWLSFVESHNHTDGAVASADGPDCG